MGGHEGAKKGLKIDSSTVGMESARSYRATSTSITRITISTYQADIRQGGNALDNTAGENAESPDSKENAGNKEAQQNTNLQDWQNRLQMTGSNVTVRKSASQTLGDIRQTTLHYIFDLLFSSRKYRLNRWRQEHGIRQQDSRQKVSAQDAQQTMQSGANGSNVYGSDTVLTANMKVFQFAQGTIQIESEKTSFSTVGTVRTSDGREINFNVNVGMSRQFQQYFEEDLEWGTFTLCDPLVINLDTDVAELSDQTFYFDIDGDGEQDEVSQLGAGSGYLALDKNGDGVINDGRELFGTASGNGFADLAEYDEDGNGWIDENDAIWDKLRIWCKDEQGRDVLYKLSDKGVGAICLQNVSTNFTLQGQAGQTKGVIRNSGVFLYENGNVGTVQHVDVAKYRAQA